MPLPVINPGDIAPGDLFEDCRYHPCLCYDVSEPQRAGAIFGISLVDGSTCQCSVAHCGVRKLTPAEAWRWKSEGPADVELERSSAGGTLDGPNQALPRTPPHRLIFSVQLPEAGRLSWVVRQTDPLNDSWAMQHHPAALGAG